MWIYNVFMFFSLASRGCINFGILFGWLWFKKKTEQQKTQKNQEKEGDFPLNEINFFWQLSTNTFSFLLSPERLDSTSLNWTKLTDREDQCCVDVIQETSEHFPLMFFLVHFVLLFCCFFFALHEEKLQMKIKDEKIYYLYTKW